MNVAELKKVIGRTPFRPFKIRLSNGAEYSFVEPRDFGAPRNLSVVFYFGNKGWTMIDTDQIAEVTD
jgi:hypothetical protein